MFYEYHHFGTSEFFYKRYGSDFSFPKHLHQSFELILLMSGCMRVRVDRTQYVLRAGEAVLIFPHQLHELESEKCEYMLIIFSPEIVRAFDRKSGNRVPVSNQLHLPPYLLKQLHELEENSSRVKMKATLYGVCAHMEAESTFAERQSTDDALLYGIFAFVEKHYDGDCSLEAACHALGVSYSYLSRYFGGTVGMSYGAYVNRYRVSRACYLLGNTDKTVLECSMECGFSSLRSFNRNFKLYTDFTPRAYREKSK